MVRSVYDRVFTDDMEYPEGMTDDQARDIWYAYEKRRIAWEMDYQIENGYPWVKDALAAIRRGETTFKEVFEEAWSYYYNEDMSYSYLFEHATKEEDV